MADPFLYVQWLSAKKNLMEALENGDTWNDRCRVVDEWFKAHVFEVGVDHTVSEELMRKHQSDFREIVNRASVGELSYQVLKNGLYMQTNNKKNDFERVFTTTVLVLGSPKVVGPSTRKL